MGSSIPANSCRTNNRCNAPSTGAGCTITVPGTCVYYSGARLSGPNINVGDTFNTVINKINNYITTGTGTVTSVALTMPSAFSVAGSPITDSGTFVVTGAGTSSQYIAGDGSLATFPSFIIPIVSIDFDVDGITYSDSSLNSITFELFFNDLNRFIYNEVGNQEWDYLVGGGFTILLPGFDANTNNYHLYLFPKY